MSFLYKFLKMDVHDYSHEKYEALPDFVKLEGKITDLNYNVDSQNVKITFCDSTGSFTFNEKVGTHTKEYLVKCLNNNANVRLLFEKENEKFSVVAFINVDEAEKHRLFLR